MTTRCAPSGPSQPAREATSASRHGVPAPSLGALPHNLLSTGMLSCILWLQAEAFTFPEGDIRRQEHPVYAALDWAAPNDSTGHLRKLVERMLNPDHNQRASISEVLQVPFWCASGT